MKKAKEEMDRKLKELMEEEIGRRKKEKRYEKIKGEERVRTYDYSRGIVKDHKTGKTASIKDILGKGLLDKLKL